MDQALPASGRGTADHLLALQRLAGSTMVFSVTRRCPLKCSHCIVSSGPDVRGPTLSEADARSWSEQLGALKEAGVRHLTFTGGEPVLALPAIRVLSEAAASLGMSTAVVTSAAWASSAKSAAHVVDKLVHISHWDIGYDRFHESEIPFERLGHAVAALRSKGAHFSIRACVDDPPSPSDVALLDRLRATVGDGVRIYQQRTRRIGRAAALLDDTPAPQSLPPEPCLSTGPFVREDGSVGPCCSGLAYEARGRHPFEFGTVQQDGLVACRQRWAADPLLRLLRLIGFRVPVAWLAEDGRRHLLPAPTLPASACELCVALWDADGHVASFLSEKAARPEVVAQLDRLEAHLFG